MVAESWERQVEFVAAKGCRVQAMQRPCGESSKGTGFAPVRASPSVQHLCSVPQELLEVDDNMDGHGHHFPLEI